MRSILILCFGMISLLPLHGQDLIGLGTRWSDSFREWDIQTTTEGRVGSLELRWLLSDDWTQWVMRLGDTTVQIRLKWKDDPNLWEIRCLGSTVTARTIWKDDFRQWRITDGSVRLRWQSRFSNIRDEWITPDTDQGSFRLYTYWEGDPRDWVIEDQLNADVSYGIRVAMIFLAVFNSMPKQ